MLPGIIIFIYGAISVGFKLSFFNIISVILVTAGATMLRGGIYTLAGSVGFWTKSNRELTAVVTRLGDLSIMYPLTIYNRVIQAILTFVLPLGFISFYPARAFLEKDAGFEFPGAVSLWTLFAGILFLSLGRGLFNMGLKHYDSAGN
jgi:ABC-2 type transport system permease protein